MAKKTITDKLGRTRKATRRSWGKVEKLPSGNLRARYTGPDGNVHTAPMTFVAAIDADAWLATQRALIAAGTWTPVSATTSADVQAERARTLLDYGMSWVETRTGRNGLPLTPRSRVEYQRLLNGPLAPLAALPVVGITTVKVRDWYSALVKTGTKTTAARGYGLLRTIMETAVIDGIVASNPCQVRGAQNASTGRTSEVPTMAELAIIEASMPDRLRAMVGIAAWGALRYGELTELRRSDVLLDDDADTIMLSVTRAVVKIPGEGFIVGPPKSAAGIRLVALAPELTAGILEHLEKHVGAEPDALLFPARKGGHMSQSTFNKSWDKARAAAGRPDLTWHTLRAFGGTRHQQIGATLAETMKFLGHSTVAAAMRYQRTTGRDAALAARMMRGD